MLGTCIHLVRVPVWRLDTQMVALALSNNHTCVLFSRKAPFVAKDLVTFALLTRIPDGEGGSS